MKLIPDFNVDVLSMYHIIPDFIVAPVEKRKMDMPFKFKVNTITS